ncbi:MAG: hypothetical protein M2R45_02506 [Verrucomicrobia subdivision 3 bacterium]|nr:hypothetical protein [Limisphaerales bacterium]MCS1413296.1 hypothetical protein [Limisphaerales bacterium]
MKHRSGCENREAASWRRALGCLVLWMFMGLCDVGHAQPLRQGPVVPGVKTDLKLIAEGKELAEYYCALCHQYPEPSLLDRKTWLGQTLPRMKIRVGLAPDYLDAHREADAIKATGVIPTDPVMTEAEFKAIVRYYVATAPETAVPQAPRPPIRGDLPLFRVDRVSYRRGTPSVTLLKYDEALKRIIVGHDEKKVIELLTGELRTDASLNIGNTPTGFVRLGSYAFVTAIGSFWPSDIPKGELLLYRSDGRFYSKERQVLGGLRRPTETALADFNGDGRQDFVIASFGNHTGELSWYENAGGGEIVEHKLFSQPGALRPQVGDFNNDGHPDIAVLVAQAWEMFFIFTNDGAGNFTGDVAFQRHPLFGHSSFEVVDFNGDGLIDILATNGDNGEYPSPAKSYHGVRVYLNLGENRFEETYFFPMNGAFQALGRDFDQDGDVDIAATSFFPDYQKSPQESFVYLENLGGLVFSPATFRQCLAGRWLTLACGDIDQDGDLDLLLGSYIYGPSPVPEGLLQAWERKGPSMMVLKNQLKSPQRGRSP